MMLNYIMCILYLLRVCLLVLFGKHKTESESLEFLMTPTPV